MNYENDKQYDAHTLKSAEPSHDQDGKPDGWLLNLSDSGCIFVTNERCDLEPRPGEVVRLYGRGFGFPVRGITIGGRIYRYQTAEQYEQAFQDEQRKKRLEKAETARAERVDRDARIAKLPAPLQERIRRFLRTRDNWAAEYEPYELFVCEEAAALHARFATEGAIIAFYAAPVDEQRLACPDMRLDQHSGNTFGAACLLARLLKSEDATLVVHSHGALCPLVGCTEYGCYAGYEGKREAAR